MRFFFICFVFLYSTLVFADKNETVVKISADKKYLIVQDSQKIKIKYPKNMKVDGDVQTFWSKDYGIVYVPMTDYTVATTLVFALNKSGKKYWSMDLEAFNPSHPLIEDKYLYLGGIGKVLKLNKQTGKVVWKKEGLYEKVNVQYEGSGEVSRQGEKIKFAKNLFVSDKTGKIDEVKK